LLFLSIGLGRGRRRRNSRDGVDFAPLVLGATMLLGVDCNEVLDLDARWR